LIGQLTDDAAHVAATVRRMPPSEPDPHGEYLRFLEKVKPGAPLSEDEWLFHFEHQNRNARSGSAIGDVAPDFALPDHTDTRRTRGELMGERGLLLVFARSADW
jgi:hypothetical protein